MFGVGAFIQQGHRAPSLWPREDAVGRWTTGSPEVALTRHWVGQCCDVRLPALHHGEKAAAHAPPVAERSVVAARAGSMEGHLEDDMGLIVKDMMKECR